MPRWSLSTPLWCSTDMAEDPGNNRVITTGELMPGALVITLNRPRAKNALGWESWKQLSAAAKMAAGDPSVRCLILTGAGGFFSAGGDLKSPPLGGHGPLS